MLPEKFIWLGVALNFIGQIIYLRSIVFGNTKPNLVSWFIWMLAPFIGVFLQLKAGAGLSVLPVFMAGFGPFLVIIICLYNKNAIWRIKSFDIVCGVISFIALILYVLTKNLEISIGFAVLADLLAGIPTLVKTYKFPETESASIYFFGIISNVIGLLILKDWHFTVYSFSAYLITFNMLIILSIYRKKLFSF